MKLHKLATALAFGLCILSALANANAAEDRSIRPFKVQVPQAALEDLRRRIAETRWPDRETVDDQSQGIQLAKLKPLVEYWGTGYDWRKAEAKLNALPQFMTTIDGVDIHFIHVRSRHPNAMPLIMTHGWPGSVFELLKTVGPLTDPTAHGGSAEDAFDLVLPSMPGYGFSGKPTDTGWGPDRIARTWAELMKRLGYTRYVAQGGDWGSPVSSAMARQAPAGLLGIHINLPAVVPPEIAAVLAAGGPAPAGLSEKERATFDALSAAAKMGNRSYAAMMGTPAADDRLRHNGLPGRPRGVDARASRLLALDVQQQRSRKVPGRGAGRRHALLADEHRDLGRRGCTGSTAARSPAFSAPEKTAEISLPVAITVFPGENYRAPETWARRAYRNLIYFHEVDKGGHFAAWEQPELFSAELRAAFRPLR